MKRRRSGSALVSTLALAVLAAGCGSGDDSGNTDGTASPGGTGKLTVVASTNVWGDIVEQVGGDAVEVHSIITDPGQDPHSYEADATTRLQLSKAGLVVENGGGYDDFVDTMLQAGTAKPKVINAVDVSGRRAPVGGGLNEHVWYDFPTVIKVAEAVAAALAEHDANRAASFRSEAERFTGQVRQLIAEEAAIKAQHAGEGVAVTEPVPLYLLEACGLVNRTPEGFSEAIEEGSGVPVGVLNDTLALFGSKSANGPVKALVYNEQTSGPETEKVLAAAKAAGVAVVPVTETVPTGQDYLGWMRANLKAVSTALGPAGTP